MTEEDILDGIRSVAREHLDYEGEVTTATPLVDALELDSVRLLTLVVEVENHFDVCLEEGDEEGVETAGDLVAVLQKRL
ncbi:MAG: acyl carrier protein [Proteobacteria bacterium]|nr:acyl carrier protein [Pseudomonadota bacterium]MCP4921364.1 acyl carrier protein [Pseudomonadota bacterium]